MRALVLTLLVACAGPGEALPLPDADLPAPAELRLEVDPTAAGTPGATRISRAPPGASVTVLYNAGGFGENCPPLLGGACIDLRPRVLRLGIAVADASGQATLPFTVPLAVGGRAVGVQAVVLGSPTLVSNAVLVWLAPAGADVGPGADADGDGRTIGDGDCHDGDASISPEAPDPLGDGIDSSCDGVDGVDGDGDRVPSVTSGGTDCDDTRASTRPGAPEACDAVDNDCDGDTDEGFPDTDGSLIPDCREVAVIVTHGALTKSALGLWSCEGLDFLDRELLELNDVLAGIHFGMVRVDEHAIIGVTATQLAPYGAVMVHNVGWGDALRAGTVDALLAMSDRPLIFLGDDTGLMVSNTEAIQGRPELFDLTHVGAYLHNGNDLYKGLGAVLVDPDHAVAGGPWGEVSSFSYAGDLDHVDLAGDGEQVLMVKDQVGTPVAWVSPEATRRAAVLMTSAYNSNTCPLLDADGVEDVAALIRNTLWWALELP